MYIHYMCQDHTRLSYAAGNTENMYMHTLQLNFGLIINSCTHAEA